MTAATRKTVRFARVVERSGQPEVHTLWVAPEKDPELKHAKNSHRVMTIEGGGASGKTDVGVVGFDRRRSKTGQFLIFPRSLKPFDGARVVGIKFDLVEQPKLVAPGNLEAIAPGQLSRRKQPKRGRSASKSEPPKKPQGKADIVTADSAVPAQKAVPKKREPDGRRLVHEVHAAMRELRRGKSVAAYQRLERAIGESGPGKRSGH